MKKVYRHNKKLALSQSVITIVISFILCFLIFKILIALGFSVNLSKALLVLFFLVSSFIILRKWFISSRFSALIIRENDIAYRKGLITRSLLVIPLKNISSVELSTNIFQRFNNSGDISLYTFGDATETCFENIQNAKEAYQLIYTLIMKK